MSSLQLWLAVLGGLVLVALIAHGAWLTRRQRVKRAEADWSPAGERIEPSIGPAVDAKGKPVASGAPSEWDSDTPFSALDDDATGPIALPPMGGAYGAMEGPGDGPAFPIGPMDATGPLEPALRVDPPRRVGPQVDALIDAIALLHLDSPVGGEGLMAHLPTTRRAGSKPLLVEGLNAASNHWEAPRAGATYKELQVAVQLANRSGALNQIEFSEFAQKVEGFAEGLQARIDLPDMLETVARAKELDAFASQHDAQLTLRLVARGAAWSPGYVQQHAQRHGFVAGALPGRLVQPGGEEGAPPVLSLQFDAQAALADDPNQSALRQLTLAFDVPQTPAEQQPFAAWCKAGQALAGSLDADLLDDNGQPLPPTAFEGIGQALDQLYEALAARELAAGSPAARRLFA